MQQHKVDKVVRNDLNKKNSRTSNIKWTSSGKKLFEYEKLRDHNVKHIIVVYVIYHFILKHILGDHNNPKNPHVNCLIYYQ